MDKPMSGLSFRVMTLLLKIRDSIRPRVNVLTEADLKAGNSVLEFGCGPGSYTVIAAGMVGTAGRIYALDIHPLALRSVERRAAKRGLTNIETILSNGATGLEDSSIDVVLLYDVFHDLDDPNSVLQELHRVLKPVGFISFSDHHMKEPDIISKVTGSGLFKLSSTGRITHTFTKTGS
jgi:ubiquinone/menaquinone biosynthesis C-methylase UbiE